MEDINLITERSRFVLLKDIKQNDENYIKRGTVFTCVENSPVGMFFSDNDIDSGRYDRVRYYVEKMQDEEWFALIPEIIGMDFISTALDKWYNKYGFSEKECFVHIKRKSFSEVFVIEKYIFHAGNFDPSNYSLINVDGERINLCPSPFFICVGALPESQKNSQVPVVNTIDDIWEVIRNLGYKIPE